MTPPEPSVQGLALVFGATGAIGGAAARTLLEAGRAVRVLVRDPARARGLEAVGAEVVVGDLAVPESLGPAFEGVEAALLVSNLVPEQVELQGNAVRAAAAAGVGHLVKISGFATATDSPVASGRWHAQTEAEIDATRLQRTFLRAPFFMQNLLHTRPHAVASGTLSAPLREGRIAMVDVRDLAAVAAAVLGDPRHHAREYLVTGPEALRFDDVAECLGTITGRPVAFASTRPQTTHAALIQGGAPPWRADLVVEFYAAFEAGLGATVTRVVEQVTGRAPTTLEAFVRQHRVAFEAGAAP